MTEKYVSFNFTLFSFEKHPHSSVHTLRLRLVKAQMSPVASRTCKLRPRDLPFTDVFATLCEAITERL